MGAGIQRRDPSAQWKWREIATAPHAERQVFRCGSDLRDHYTTDANVLVADIHDRMPVILAPADYARWFVDESDPRDLMRPFLAELTRMWPISIRVNKLENDDPSIAEPIELRPVAVEGAKRPRTENKRGHDHAQAATRSPGCRSGPNGG